jgi:hypothetical protein
MIKARQTENIDSLLIEILGKGYIFDELMAK